MATTHKAGIRSSAAIVVTSLVNPGWEPVEIVVETSLVSLRGKRRGVKGGGRLRGLLPWAPRPHHVQGFVYPDLVPRIAVYCQVLLNPTLVRPKEGKGYERQNMQPVKLPIAIAAQLANLVVCGCRRDAGGCPLTGPANLENPPLPMR